MRNDSTHSRQLVDDLLELYTELLIPFMKVRRDMPFPSEPERQETDGEHAFTLSMMAITLAEELQPQLDKGLIAQYALVHDLVEAYAGDISVRAAQHLHDAKAQREHQALLKIEKQFATTAPWMAALIRRYEARVDDESRFVYVVDKMMGALARLADDGASWAEYYPETDGSGYHAAVERLRAKAKLYPELLDLFDVLHDHLDKQWPRYLKLAGKST